MRLGKKSKHAAKPKKKATQQQGFVSKGAKAASAYEKEDGDAFASIAGLPDDVDDDAAAAASLPRGLGKYAQA